MAGSPRPHQAPAVVGPAPERKSGVARPDLDSQTGKRRVRCGGARAIREGRRANRTPLRSLARCHAHPARKARAAASSRTNAAVHEGHPVTFFCGGREVSTGRAMMRQADKARSAFETRAFYLACFLRCAGYELLNLHAEGRRKVFVFQDQLTRRDDVMAFYGDTATVRPLAFAATIKDMKGLLHNG